MNGICRNMGQTAINILVPVSSGSLQRIISSGPDRVTRQGLFIIWATKSGHMDRTEDGCLTDDGPGADGARDGVCR